MQSFLLNCAKLTEYSGTSRYECPDIRVIGDTSAVEQRSFVLKYERRLRYEERCCGAAHDPPSLLHLRLMQYPTYSPSVLVYLAVEASLLSFSRALRFLCIYILLYHISFYNHGSEESEWKGQCSEEDDVY
ncbi:hypothetical protein AVEN_9818-1 [Araneus ventricosus]|uniref:Uncharacterized protein n=1 Tax=Araneus ventricosus TaxID=182803 RepID=A0A4Y2ENS4_ARAVE|nr:hypothetical protein AVEN_9818-1 [Araneus ventricosus]